MASVTDEQATSVFSANLRRLMDERDIKQCDLAESLGESEARISHYRSGNRQPTIGVATRIAEFFGVGVDELLSRDAARGQKKSSRKSA